jgi:hypothetical protein
MKTYKNFQIKHTHTLTPFKNNMISKNTVRKKYNEAIWPISGETRI